MWAFYLDRAEHQTARQLGEELLTIAQRQHDPTLLVGAHRALGESLEWLGELTAGQAHLQQGIALANPQHLQSRTLFIGQSPDLDCLSRIAPVQWRLGYPDQALRQCREALSLARVLAHPHSLASCLGWGTMLFQLCREREETLRHADEAVTLCTEQGLPFWLSMATILRGWALAELGDREEGTGQLRAGLAAWRAAGSEIIQPYWFTLLAEACGKTGEFAEGIKLLDESLVLINKTGERFYQAEVYRIKGQLILEAPVQEQEDRIRKAETCFRKAIETAQKQQAKSWELRASTSLARLWRSQGKTVEAHTLLAGVYNWFTEGFDTKDLQEAKALIEELES